MFLLFLLFLLFLFFWLFLFFLFFLIFLFLLFFVFFLFLLYFLFFLFFIFLFFLFFLFFYSILQLPVDYRVRTVFTISIHLLLSVDQQQFSTRVYSTRRVPVYDNCRVPRDSDKRKVISDISTHDCVFRPRRCRTLGLFTTRTDSRQA